jgi:hypothetical protein
MYINKYIKSELRKRWALCSEPSGEFRRKPYSPLGLKDLALDLCSLGADLEVGQFLRNRMDRTQAGSLCYICLSRGSPLVRGSPGSCFGIVSVSVKHMVTCTCLA